MSAQKMPFQKAVKPQDEFEPIDPNGQELAAAEDCCVCDNSGTSWCSPESPAGMVFTLTGTQFGSYWNMGR